MSNRLEKYMEFYKEQEKLKEEYIAAGMTAEQIEAIQEFDLAMLNSDLKHDFHDQSIEGSCGEEELPLDLNPLLLKFSDRFSCEMQPDTNKRFWWIDEIEDEKLFEKISSLNEEDLTLLDLYIFQGLTLSEIAKKKNVSVVAIHKKIKKIKIFLKNG